MFVADTSILIHAAIEESDEHEKAYRALNAWRRGSEAWFVTWSIGYEFLRVTTHRSVFERPLKIAEAWHFLQTLMDTPGFGVLAETAHHHEVLSELIGEHPRISGNILHDLHTVALMKEHGIREIRTADSDFHQFKFLKVVNPLGR